MSKLLISRALFAMVTALASMASAPAWAQRGGGGYGATNSQGNMGAATNSRLPFSNGGRQTGGALGTGMGSSMSSSAFGSSGMGSAMGSGAGQGTGGMFGQNGVNQTGQGFGQNGGQPFQQGGFVGRDAEDVRGNFQNMSGRDRRGMMFDMMVENLNEMRDSRRRDRQQNMPAPPVRVRLQPAFDLPLAAPSATAGLEIQTRVNQSLATRGIGTAQIEISGGTAVLRGAVSTPRDRALVERLASLEPGISQVQNLLTIAPPEVSQP